MASAGAWQSVAAKAQQSVLDSIPAEWKLPQGMKASREKSALEIMGTCGLLSQEQLKITELTATELLKSISSGSLSCVDATKAFLIRYVSLVVEAVPISLLTVVKGVRSRINWSTA